MRHAAVPTSICSGRQADEIIVEPELYGTSHHCLTCPEHTVLRCNERRWHKRATCRNDCWSTRPRVEKRVAVDDSTECAETPVIEDGQRHAARCGPGTTAEAHRETDGATEGMTMQQHDSGAVARWGLVVAAVAGRQLQ